MSGREIWLGNASLCLHSKDGEMKHTYAVQWLNKQIANP